MQPVVVHGADVKNELIVVWSAVPVATASAASFSAWVELEAATMKVLLLGADTH